MGLFNKLFGSSEMISRDSSNIYANDYKKEFRLRVENGEPVEEWCIDASSVKGLPYICFSDYEISCVEKALNSRDDLQGTRDIMYAAGRYMQLNEELEESNPLIEINRNRAKVWIDEICKRASQGSLYAQAVVYSDWPFVRDYIDIQEMIFENLGNKGESFGANIVNEINKDNPNAMLAYASFSLFDNVEKEKERKMMLLNAGALGLVEGYTEYHDSMSFNDRWTTPEGEKISTLIAELNNGPTSYYYQAKLGCDYWYGEGFVDKPNQELGYKWLTLAAKNGDNTAIAVINSLRSNGEI